MDGKTVRLIGGLFRQRKAHRELPGGYVASHLIEKGCQMDEIAVLARRREIAVEHIVFRLIEYVEQSQPGLLDFIGDSLDHLGDPARDETKDDEAVRDVVRRVLASARDGSNR